MFRVLPLLIIALVVGAVTWMFLIVPTDPDPVASTGAGVQAELLEGPEQREPAAVDAMPLEPVAEPMIDTNAQRTEAVDPLVTGARQIQVRNSNGEVTPDASVAFIITSREQVGEDWEQLLEMREYLEHSYWWRMSSLDLAQCDSNGVAHLPEQGIGIAIADYEGERGLIPFGEFDPASTEPLQLDLKPYSRFRVKVVDAVGSPVDDILVMASVGSRKESERMKGRYSSFSMHGNLIGPSSRTDENGEAWLSTSVPPAVLERMQIEPDDMLVQVMATAGGDVRVTQEVALEQQGEVQLQLDASGTVSITLIGYPDSVVPILTERRSRRGRAPDLRPELEKSSDGSWTFLHVPLNKSFEVGFRRRTVDGSQVSYSSVAIDAERLNGPTVHGENVQAEFERKVVAQLTGRLLDQEGSPAEIKHRNLGMNVEARGLIPGEPAVIWPFSFELEADGSFVATVGKDQQGNSRSLSDFTEFLIELPVSSRTEGGSLSVDSTWVKVPLTIPNGTVTHDLGELTLGQVDPLLQIHCVNARDEPVPGVRLHIETEAVLRETKDWRRVRARMHGEILTNEEGTLRLPGFSAEVDLAPIFGQGTGRYRVKTQHSDYLSLEVPFDLQLKIFQIDMRDAASLTGKVQLYQAVDELNVYALNPGAEAHSIQDTFAELRLKGWTKDRERSGLEAVEQEFKISPLPYHPIDLVFYLGSHGGEVYRIANFDPSQTSSLAEVLDLRPHMNAYEIELYDVDGTRFPSQPNSQYAMVREYEAGGRGSSGSGTHPFAGYFYCFSPNPPTNKITISVDGSKEVDVTSLPPGRNVVRLDSPRPIQLRFELSKEVPSGHQVHARFYQGRRVENADAIAGADQATLFHLPGEYLVSWELRDAEGQLVRMTSEQWELTREDFESGEVLTLEVPEDLIPD